MQNSGSLMKNNSLRLTHQLSPHRLGLCSQVATNQPSSPTVFPEKRGKVKASRRSNTGVTNEDIRKAKGEEHRIDMGDEKSDLLGYQVISGKLALDKRKTKKKTEASTATEVTNQEMLDAKLTSKALIWGPDMLHLDEVISVSYNVGMRHFTVHAYPVRKKSFFKKSGRSRKDFRLLATSPEEAVHWVAGFADQQCFVNCLPHPLKQTTDSTIDFTIDWQIRSKSPPKILVILNPRSGHGRSTKVFHETVEPIFKLAGFRMEVVKTTCAGHARKLAASVDFSICPNGIICVGGDGIVNEVLNGLLGRDNQKEAISIPIGIIPAGSDNSLVWTVLGVRDPLSAAIAIVKGGLTATDVFAVEWIQTGVIHFGMTVSYFGFVSDVLELSEKYQKRFGPLRYLVAGVLKFLCLPKYNFDVEYLPASKEPTNQQQKLSGDKDVVDVSDLYTDIMKKSNTEGLPRASSLSSIDSVMSPGRIDGGDLDTCTEPSDYVRGLDPKTKRLSSGSRGHVSAEPEVIHPQLPLSATPNWPRTRSRSKKGFNSTHESIRSSSGTSAIHHDKEDISSTMSDPGPIWDTEPKWDTEPGWDVENPIELPGPADDMEGGSRRGFVPREREDWVATKGQFLGILVCNHSCKTVQSLSNNQVVAPKAEHDDYNLDLLLVRGSGRFRLLRFFVLLQMGRHLSLPYVEYIKVKSVKIKGKQQYGVGIDGELFPVNGQVVSSLLPEQCRLIGRSPNCKN